MTTKYAAARDVAYQWRSEYRKVKQENKSLRRVYAEAKALLAKMPHDEATFDLRDAVRNAVFAVVVDGDMHTKAGNLRTSGRRVQEMGEK